MAPTVNVYALNFSVHIHHPADGDREEFTERGGHQQLNVAAADGPEAQELVRVLFSSDEGPRREVVFHGGPSLIVGGVHVVPSSWHAAPEPPLPSAADLDRVEADKAAAAATGEGEDASL